MHPGRTAGCIPALASSSPWVRDAVHPVREEAGGAPLTSPGRPGGAPPAPGGTPLPAPAGPSPAALALLVPGWALAPARASPLPGTDSTTPLVPSIPLCALFMRCGLCAPCLPCGPPRVPSPVCSPEAKSLAPLGASGGAPGGFQGGPASAGALPAGAWRLGLHRITPKGKGERHIRASNTV